MISTRHLHPHAANTTTAQLRPGCCTAIARPLHDFHLAIAPLLHDFCPAIALLLPGDCTASARLRKTFGSRSSAHAPGTETMPKTPKSPVRMPAGRLKAACTKLQRAGLCRVGSHRNGPTQSRPTQTKLARTEPNQTCPVQASPGQTPSGHAPSNQPPLPGRVHARTDRATAAQPNSTTRCKLFFTSALYGGCASAPFDRCPMQISQPENKSSYK